MASTLKHDQQGFLIGELIDGSRDILRTQEASLQVFRGMRADVKSILRALKVEAEAPSFHAPAGRAPSGGMKAIGAPPVAQPAAGAVAATARAAAVVSPAGRDGRGRFTAKTAGAPGRPISETSAAGATSRLTSAVNRLSTSLAAPADNLDPTINAVKEVTEVVGPLGRGLFSMFGRGAERKKERWYGRIWSALTDGNKIAKGNKPLSAGGSTSLSIGGGLLGRAGGAIKGAGGLLGGLVKRGGGLLRRIPVLGALLAGGGALASMFGMDDDPAKSAEENRTQRYRGTGEALVMGVGGVLGGVLGSLLGPAGTVAGALVGSLVGEKVGAAVGDWTKGLVDSDIPGKIVEGWNVFTAGVSAAWESLATDVKTAWGAIATKAGEWWDKTAEVAKTISDKVGDLATGMNDWFKSKTGIDIGQTVSDAVGSVKSTAANAWTAAKGYASEAGAAVADGRVGSALIPNTVKRAVAAGTAAATQAKAGYDEARGNPTTAPTPANALQSGARTAGNMAGNGINRIVETGAGYNVVQRSDRSVVRQDGARNWRNNNPGNIEWKEGGFASRHGAIGSDGRFAIFPSYEAGRAAKAALIFEGPNYKDKSLTAAIARYAPPSENNTAAYQRSVLAAVGGANKRMSEYTPAEREAIMDAMRKVEGYRAGKTTIVSAGAVVMPRAAATVKSPTVPTGVASNVPPSVPPSIPALPTETVPAVTGSGSGAGRGSVGVTIRSEVSQNVPDRGIAHVQTGGIGGA